MVVSLGPGKFYGTSLPRPRIYTDVKFNDHRVDPPVSVADPLMSWAREAHWSMGGLSFKRLHLQGKIEGNVDRLRAQLESLSHSGAQSQSPPPHFKPTLSRGSKRPAVDSPPPPPAPIAPKRRRLTALIEEDEENEEGKEEEVRVKAKSKAKDSKRCVGRRLVKKLGDDFDRVASENGGADVADNLDLNAVPNDVLDSVSASTKRSRRRLMKGGEAVTNKVVDESNKSSDPKEKKSGQVEKRSNSSNVVRTSPRLAKSRSN
ncbi:hypothetical protein HN51_043522 [Arachis hypogaea]|uniref:Uncharacterized protein n=1 Tax=Arachis hypogaea TaxID=3818 RepID=A0A444Y6B7_ARAHY|nr:uncharacterized protein LOC107613349 [Arachis ipaensis]XP_025671222.1 uncharacterized protein LOC112770938 [Arachis hypogaea]QHN95576.1 uncharacterized protein DS421_18g610890 [Arachis hypogaea]RYQ97447.1 hypothetical protein Ahy_B08g093495 [Arachis hypogaea]